MMRLALPRVPRRIKQVVWKFIHCKRLTRKERGRLVRWINRRHRDLDAPPMRAMPDGRYSVFELL